MPTATRQPRSRRRVEQPTYTLGCEIRAEDENHAHRWVADNAIEVKADSQTGWYLVAFEVRGDNLWFRCTCPAGTYRPHLPVPCKHSAKLGRLLEGRGQAVMQAAAGTWQPAAAAAPVA
jgi:hypothetical protein